MKVKIMSKDGYTVIDLNRRKGLREKCLNCSCCMPSEITSCIFTDCPLHPLRTGRGKQNPKARIKSIRKYCLWCQAEQPSEVRKCGSPNCPLFAYRKGNVDHSIEINSDTKFAYIEPVSEGKTIQGIQ